MEAVAGGSHLPAVEGAQCRLRILVGLLILVGLELSVAEALSLLLSVVAAHRGAHVGIVLSDGSTEVVAGEALIGSVVLVVVLSDLINELSALAPALRKLEHAAEAGVRGHLLDLSPAWDPAHSLVQGSAQLFLDDLSQSVSIHV